MVRSSLSQWMNIKLPSVRKYHLCDEYITWNVLTRPEKVGPMKNSIFKSVDKKFRKIRFHSQNMRKKCILIYRVCRILGNLIKLWIIWKITVIKKTKYFRWAGKSQGFSSKNKNEQWLCIWAMHFPQKREENCRFSMEKWKCVWTGEIVREMESERGSEKGR